METILFLNQKVVILLAILILFTIIMSIIVMSIPIIAVLKSLKHDEVVKK